MLHVTLICKWHSVAMATTLFESDADSLCHGQYSVRRI